MDTPEISHIKTTNNISFEDCNKIIQFNEDERRITVSVISRKSEKYKSKNIFVLDHFGNLDHFKDMFEYWYQTHPEIKTDEDFEEMDQKIISNIISCFNANKNNKTSNILDLENFEVG